jgi:hypothetical protein
MIEMMRAPLASGGYVFLLVHYITGAAANKDNLEWTDVFIDTESEPFTINMEVEIFSAIWVAALQGDIDELEELNDAEDSATTVH